MHEAGVCGCSQQKHALACTWLFQESMSCLELEICSTFSLTVSFLVEADRATTAAHHKVVTAWPYCVHFRTSQSMHTCVSCKPPTSEVSCRFDPSCPHPERQEMYNKQSKGAEREVRGGKEKQQGSPWWRVLVQNAFKTEYLSPSGWENPNGTETKRKKSWKSNRGCWLYNYHVSFKISQCIIINTHKCLLSDHFMHCNMMLSPWQINCCISLFYLSFGNEVCHNGGVAKLGCKMNAAATLAINQRRVCAIFHELHHHG